MIVFRLLRIQVETGSFFIDPNFLENIRLFIFREKVNLEDVVCVFLLCMERVVKIELVRVF
jgi:hypothetical protein